MYQDLGSPEISGDHSWEIDFRLVDNRDANSYEVDQQSMQRKQRELQSAV